MSNSQSASLAEKESGFRSVRLIRTPDQSSALTNSSMRLSTDSPYASSGAGGDRAAVEW